ncbi:hypothetical protein CDO81_00045 [Roseateles puraquae]|uniref:Uncharacterized protein n=1 Tax=Roseateles puraquae TaxID=431059 RepID=A0A254NF39_9BURK|nr:hypothetical protein CDO81_00045 [Roseateles puraquae]
MRFVRALGVIKRLKVEQEYLSKVDEHRLLLFDERCKHYVRAVRPREAHRKTKVTVRFADHINKCLKAIGRAMTPAGGRRVGGRKRALRWSLVPAVRNATGQLHREVVAPRKNVPIQLDDVVQQALLISYGVKPPHLLHQLCIGESLRMPRQYLRDCQSDADALIEAVFLGSQGSQVPLDTDYRA